MFSSLSRSLGKSCFVLLSELSKRGRGGGSRPFSEKICPSRTCKTVSLSIFDIFVVSVEPANFFFCGGGRSLWNLQNCTFCLSPKNLQNRPCRTCGFVFWVPVEPQTAFESPKPLSKTYSKIWQNNLVERGGTWVVYSHFRFFGGGIRGSFGGVWGSFGGSLALISTKNFLKIIKNYYFSFLFFYFSFLKRALYTTQTSRGDGGWGLRARRYLKTSTPRTGLFIRR